LFGNFTRLKQEIDNYNAEGFRRASEISTTMEITDYTTKNCLLSIVIMSELA